MPAFLPKTDVVGLRECYQMAKQTGCVLNAFRVVNIFATEVKSEVGIELINFQDMKTSSKITIQT